MVKNYVQVVWFSHIVICWSEMALSIHVWSNTLHMWGSIHTVLLNRVKFKALTDCLQLLSHHCSVALLAIFYCIFMLTADLPSSCSLTTQDFLPLTLILFTSLMQELIGTLSHSYLSLVNSGTPCLLLPFLLPMS